MSKADRLFEVLGYRIYLNDEETLIYKHETERFEYSITFDKREFKKTFHAVEGIFVPKDVEQWSTQEFKNEWLKYCASEGHWENIWHEFSIQELQAINLKCRELGWIGGEDET